MMLDLLQLIIPVLFGAGIGGATVAMLTRRAAAPQPLQPICSCEDGYGTHDPATGKCQGQIKRPIRWEEEWPQNAIHFEWVPCPCTHYDGPDPDALRLLRGA